MYIVQDVNFDYCQLQYAYLGLRHKVTTMVPVILIPEISAKFGFVNVTVTPGDRKWGLPYAPL